MPKRTAAEREEGKETVRRLRSFGLSFKEIEEASGVPDATCHRWARNVLAGTDPYGHVCPLCARGFASRGALRYHRTVTGGACTKCRNCGGELRGNWYESMARRGDRVCRNCALAARVRRLNDARAEALRLLDPAGKCGCCGQVVPPEFQAVHHRRRNGGRRRRLNPGEARIGPFIVRNGARDLELRCHNCNGADAHHPGGCPHRARRGTNRPGLLELGRRLAQPVPAPVCSRCGRAFRDPALLTSHWAMCCAPEGACARCGDPAGRPRGTYCDPCRARIRRQRRRNDRAVLRYRVIVEILHDRCFCCGETEYAFLTLNHVHGKGASDFARYSDRSALYRRIIRDPHARTKYQTACYNCNSAWGYYGRCVCAGELGRSRSARP